MNHTFSQFRQIYVYNVGWVLKKSITQRTDSKAYNHLKKQEASVTDPIVEKRSLSNPVKSAKVCRSIEGSPYKLWRNVSQETGV